MRHLSANRQYLRAEYHQWFAGWLVRLAGRLLCPSWCLLAAGGLSDPEAGPETDPEADPEGKGPFGCYS